MALNIKSPECDRLARELVALTGESITTAIQRSLEQRLQRELQQRSSHERHRRARIHEHIRQLQEAPVLDHRPVDEILGYNDKGTFE